jgi:hypothetical protein
MKKFVSLTLIAVVALAFSACKKSTTDPNNNNNNNNVSALTATVNGNMWTSITLTGTNQSGIIAITAINLSGSAIGMEIPTATTGMHSIDGLTTNVTYTNGQVTYLASSGTIIIASYENNIIKGTFQCSLVNTKNPIDKMDVSNGLFSVTLQ